MKCVDCRTNELCIKHRAIAEKEHAKKQVDNKVKDYLERASDICANDDDLPDTPKNQIEIAKMIQSEEV